MTGKRVRTSAGLSGLVILLMLAGTGQAATRYADAVNGNDHGGANLCIDAATPCRTIGQAIYAAAGGDVIRIAPAIYTESLTIEKPLTLQGAGQADTIIQAHPQPGQAAGRVIVINKAEVTIADVTIRHGVSSSGGGINAWISSLQLLRVRLENNRASFFAESAGGGLALGGGSSAELAHVIFAGNFAVAGGGGMYIGPGSSAQLTDVNFTENTVTRRGGGLYGSPSPGGALSFTNVRFLDNHAGDDGGGMHSLGGAPELVKVDFLGNRAGRYGGGMHIVGGDPELVKVSFMNNQAELGGGMYVRASSPKFREVTFQDNRAGNNGGGMYVIGDSSPTLYNVLFRANRALGTGGGIRFVNSEGTFVNVSFIGNLAEYGAGMSNSGSDALLVNALFSGNAASRQSGAIRNFSASNLSAFNVTISGNTAVETGGGIHNLADSQSYWTNAIVWGNQAGTGDGHEFRLESGTSASCRYCIVREGAGSVSGPGQFHTENSMDADPLFAVPAAGNFRLRENSPAVDAGDPDFPEEKFPDDGNGNRVDLDGRPRFYGARIDIGAYEWQPLSDGIFADRFEAIP